jgi:TRAP-type C4-dicarboxylate transport system permease small subunit
MLDRLLGRLEAMSRYAVWAGGAMLIFAAGMVTVDVLTRKLLGWSMAGSDEITGYLFAISTAWSYAFTLLGRANVRIDALYEHMPKPVRAVLDVVALLALTGFMGFVTYWAYRVFRGSLGAPFGETDVWSLSITPLSTPLALPQGLWLLGLALFMITAVVLLLRVLASLAHGDWGDIARRAGTRTYAEEVEDELAGHSIRDGD